MKEQIEYVEIVERVDEMFAQELPGFICAKCGTKFYAMYNEGSDFIIAHPLDLKNRFTQSCNSHINFDLLINPIMIDRVVVPRSYQTLDGQKIIIGNPTFAQLFIGNRFN